MLARHASSLFSSASTTTKSWFWRLRILCLQYCLPHPASWLNSQPNKLHVKKIVKSAVVSYWRDKMTSEAESLSSLRYLKTRFLSLTICHPFFRTCGSSVWEVEKATCQARLLSGRGKFERLTRHWTPWNQEGLCTLPDCWGTHVSHQGTIESFLLSCPSLQTIRQSLVIFTKTFISSTIPHLSSLVNMCLELNSVQFWLDCSVMAPVITEVQVNGDQVLKSLFKITRNYCYGLFKARKKMLEMVGSTPDTN